MSSTTVRDAASEEAGVSAQPRVCERAREAVVPSADATASSMLRARLGR